MRARAIGDRVSQSQYGDGTITMVNEYHTVVDFDLHGTRTFSTPIVQLVGCDTIAPVRVKGTRRRKVSPKT